METLEEYNARRNKELKLATSYPKLNGIGCPKCGEELFDTGGSSLMSYPAQKRVNCGKCGFKGYRVI